jgi:inorganic triphosphatase YgiF
MTPNHELELKFEIAPAQLPTFKKIPSIRALKNPPRRTREISVYFDTDKHKLHKNGLLLRVRRIGKRYIQTIKATTNSRLFERAEWETEIEGNEPDLSIAAGTALEPLLNDRLRRRLKPLFETRVRRTVYPIVDETRAIELAVDRGTIDTGTRSVPICEIELELKRGEVADLFAVARELTLSLPTRLALKSKSERGHELVEGEQSAPIGATGVELTAGLSKRESFRMIGRSALKQVVGNESALIDGDPEAVHQMRVGLRRLRAAMSMFAELLQDRQSGVIKDELRWLGKELGPARELEVLLSHVVTPLKKQQAQWEGIPSVRRELTKEREAAMARARDAVMSGRFRSLTLETAAWLEAGEWTRPQDDLVRDLGNTPVVTFAASQLSKRWRKVRKKGRGLANLDPASRHKVRIQAKKLRYAVEFFASLFSGRQASKRGKFLRAVEQLQDGLGDLNDIAVHRDRIAGVADRSTRARVRRAFAAGLLAGREDARAEVAMKEATSAYAKLAKVKRFW